MRKSDEERIDQICESLTEDERNHAFGYMMDLTNGLRKLTQHEGRQGVTFFGSARVKTDDKYYKLAREFAGKLAKCGITIATGGASGIMEAANRGAYESGGVSLGFNIKLPHEQGENPYLTDSLTFDYFFARKVILVAVSRAWVFFPGGFGTLDELMEVLTLVQTGKVQRRPIILFGSEFWNNLDKYFDKDLLGKYNFIDQSDRQIYTITDDIDEAIELITSVLPDANCLI